MGVLEDSSFRDTTVNLCWYVITNLPFPFSGRDSLLQLLLQLGL